MGRKSKFYLLFLGGLLVLSAGAVLTALNSHLIGWSDAGEKSCRAYALVIEGTDTRVEGAEDIEIDWGRGLAYISAYNRIKVEDEIAAGGPVYTTGGLYRLDLNQLDLSSDTIEVRDVLLDFKDRGNLRPHGISLWRMNDLVTSLFFVNRRYETIDGEILLKPTIEVFDIIDGILVQRSSDGTLSDDRLCGPNDLTAVGPNRFFVTNDHGVCGGAGEFWEELLGQKKSFVMYYNGTEFSVVADGIAYANGIALVVAKEPDGHDLLLVSATRETAVHIYDVSQLEETGSLAHVGQIETGISPDNITLDSTGHIYIAGFPNIYRFAAFRDDWFGIEHVPSAALAYMNGILSPPVKYFANKGGLLTGATVANGFGDLRMVMSGFDHKLVICQSG